MIGAEIAPFDQCRLLIFGELELSYKNNLLFFPILQSAKIIIGVIVNYQFD